MLSECETFYRDIYSSKADCDNSRINDLFFGNNSSKLLNLEEKEKCDGVLTKAECLQALKSMKSGKRQARMVFRRTCYLVYQTKRSLLSLSKKITTCVNMLNLI